MLNLIARKETAPAIADFGYIEEKIEQVTKLDKNPTDAEMKKAKEEGQSRVAGFRVHDPDKEKAALDRLVAKRNAALESFISDRKAARQKIKDLGVTCLAVVPSKAWLRICKDAGMVVVAPNSDGAVSVNRAYVGGFKSAARLEAAAKEDHAAYIRGMLDNPHSSPIAHIVLPTPPQDVMETLLKVKSLQLKTAAVPEAVNFRETPSELFAYEKATQDEEQRYRDWLKYDPIIFHEHGSVAAIIAQFGDFPIEKQVVDAVVEADDFIPESAYAATGGAGSFSPFSNLNDAYLRQHQMQREIMRQMGQTQGLAFGGAVSGLQGMTTTNTAYQQGTGGGLLGHFR